jgi:ATPase subunit of ABC transporter with duplicated ATPase domains
LTPPARLSIERNNSAGKSSLMKLIAGRSNGNTFTAFSWEPPDRAGVLRKDAWLK